MRDSVKAETQELKRHYFDIRRRKVEGQYFLVFLLGVYFYVFQVFRPFLDRKLKIYGEEWEKRIQRLADELKRRHKEYAQVDSQKSSGSGGRE